MKNTLWSFIVLSVLLFSSCESAKQENKENNKEVASEVPAGWTNLAHKDFSVSYPKDWELDTSGMMQTSAILKAPLDEKHPNFNTNINIIEQDLGTLGAAIKLKDFTDLSLKQLESAMENYKLLSSETKGSGANEHQEVTFNCKQQGFDLTLCQYYYIKSGKATIVTFTATQDSYDGIKEKGIQIMNTFRSK